ncbi:MAG TPA: hypothetical protein VLB84_12950 [Bacteroidia bacterium]|nr:hypothetical protein [Bacteroidia bacterium]
MRPLWYILDKDKNPVPAKDAAQANRLLTDTEARRVALDKIFLEDYGVIVTISTVFLVLDHSHSPKSKPVLFESLIFNGDETESMNRYCTWKEAVEGHKKMVELAKNNIWVGRILDKISAEVSNTKLVTEKIIEGLKNELFYN